MGNPGLQLGRRSFLHGLIASFGLWSCKAEQTGTDKRFVLLREPVAVSLADLIDNGGTYEFEAWLTPEEGPDKLLQGILLKERDYLAAYSTFCPHEACIVKLEPNPSELNSVIASDAVLPDNAVMYCACHFSVFDIRSSGRLISGPANRGLYRFLFERRGDTIIITHIEASVLEVYV